MLRQRVHLETSALASVVARALVVVLGGALVFYGVMLVMLATKVSPSTVDSISGYRAAYDYLAGLDASDISGAGRAIVAAVGLAVGLGAALLLWRAAPRPYLARHPLLLSSEEVGDVVVRPRAMERVVELAALEDPRVVGARARFDDAGVVLNLRTKDAPHLVEILRGARSRARASLERHGLELERVDVTFAGYEGSTRRELK